MISEASYRKLTECHRRALRKIELDLEFFLLDVGPIDVFSTTSRMKTYESAMRKARSMGIEVNDLDDLAGLRVIVGTQDEIPVLERFFTRQELANDLRIVKRHSLDKRDGYRAAHLVLEVSGGYSAFCGRVEVQLCTIFGHAFNFLSRSWKYKRESQATMDWEKRFIQMSSALRKLEEDAEFLHSDIIHGTTNASESPLTPHSLRLLTQEEFSEDLSMADAVDLCRFYVDIGYRTNGEVRGFFRIAAVQDLYRLLQDHQDHQAVQILLKMGKSGFWSAFGTRISTPGLREFFNMLVEDKRPLREA